ncbi:unnamed protein product [Closterium sp. Naga37s-1]|nr:unnamed protein product [Closterium sp. Naga37s-1]
MNQSRNLLIYSFISRGDVVLVEYTPYGGNFRVEAMKGLKKAVASTKGKYSYPFDELTFNYLTFHGITYMVMADCMYGRRLPFVYLEKLKDLFVDKYGGRSLDSLQANALNQEFGPLMKELMEFSMHNSDEMKQLAKLKAQVLEVQSTLTNNIEQVEAASAKVEEDRFPQKPGRSRAREKLHGSLVRYIMVDGSPIVALLPDDPHHVNLLMDDRASLTVGGTDPPALIRSLLTSGQMPPRVALLGELVAVDSSETPFILRRFTAKAEAAAAAVARLEAALPSPPSSPLPCPPPLSQTVAEGGGGGKGEEEALTFFRMEARSCQLVDFKGKRTSLPVADVKPAATDPLATSLVPLLLALNSSAASRTAFASFCEAFLQVPARPQTTFLFSADRRGFNLLSQSMQPPQQQHAEESSPSEKPQWREFRPSLRCSSLLLLAAFALSLRLPLVSAATFQGDTDALLEFKAAVANPSALSWPDSGGDPCIDDWSHVTCTRDAITQEHRISSLLIDGLNLGGSGSPFPAQLARLAYLRALFIGNNGFVGEIPRELGELARMEQLGLDHNGFTSAPQDLFANMTALEALYLQSNPLGGQPPPDLSANTNLKILLLTNCSFTGELPSYLASLVALTNVSLGLNAFDGGIPEGMFGAHMPSLLSLRLNNNRLTGPIPASLASAPLLSELWLHGNDLSGPIPDALGGPLSLLQSVKIYENGLVGMLPDSLGEARQLSELQVQRNKLVGPIPAFMERFGEGSWGENGWCAASPGDACSDEAMALLEFLRGVEYAPALSDSWVANDPCSSGSAGNSPGGQSSSATWLGVGCSADGQVTSLTIPSQNLNGTISASLARLPALEMLQLPDNNLEGSLPAELAQLPALRAVNVANNQLTGPLPDFPPQVTVAATGNKLEGGGSAGGDAPAAAAPPSSPPPVTNSSGESGGGASSGGGNSSSSGSNAGSGGEGSNGQASGPPSSPPPHAPGNSSKDGGNSSSGGGENSAPKNESGSGTPPMSDIQISPEGPPADSLGNSSPSTSPPTLPSAPPASPSDATSPPPPSASPKRASPPPVVDIEAPASALPPPVAPPASIRSNPGGNARGTPSPADSNDSAASNGGRGGHGGSGAGTKTRPASPPHTVPASPSLSPQLSAPPSAPGAPSPTSATPSLPPPTSDTSRTASSAPGASAPSPPTSPPPPDASAPALSTPLIAVIAVAALLLLLLVLCAGVLGMRYWRGKWGSGGRKGAAATTSQVLPSVAPSPHTSAASSAPYSSATEGAAGGGYSAALAGAGGAASGGEGAGGSGWGSGSGLNGGVGGDVVLNLGAWAGSNGGRSGSGGLSTGSGSMGSGGSMGAGGSAGAGMSGMVMRMDVIRAATGGFAAENIIGKGGFGTVYKGELADGTGVAVKRMEVAQLAKKGDSEFQAEIEVLSSVRHRHLLGLLGYAVEGNERVLVYQLMARGPLSRHLFDHRRLALPPLTWRARVSVALDVARGVEYLHSLAHTSFIHRDLKASNILLDEGMRARVADFGLVKHSKGDGMQSIETRIAGTFGYLAPEYAVTGRVTTRSDVYSYGVVLMELITGRRALDDSKADEAAHLATWLTPLVPLRDQLAKVVDPILLPEMPEEHGPAHGYGGVFTSVCAMADLAVTCVARDPRQRPSMGGVVGVLAPLLQQLQQQEQEEAQKEQGKQVCEEDVSVAGIDLGSDGYPTPSMRLGSDGYPTPSVRDSWSGGWASDRSESGKSGSGERRGRGSFSGGLDAAGEPVSWTKGGSFIIKRIGDQLEDVLVEKGACKRAGRGEEETKGLLLCAEDSLRGSDGCDAEGIGSEAEGVRKGPGLQTQKVADIGAGKQRGREGRAAGSKLMSEVVVGAGVRRGGGGEHGGGNVKGVGGGMSLAEQYARQGSWEGGSSDASARSIPTFIQPRLALSGR